MLKAKRGDLPVYPYDVMGVVRTINSRTLSVRDVSSCSPALIYLVMHPAVSAELVQAG